MFRLTSCFAVLVVLVGVGQSEATWSITQITHNNYDDRHPKVFGSNIVWWGYDGNDYDIFLYDGNTTTQLHKQQVR